MATWLKWGSGCLVLIAAGLALAIWYGSARWRGRTSDLIDKLVQAHSRKGSLPVDFRKLEGLPTPVARYFRRSLTDGQPMIHSARIIWEGGFRTRRESDKWSELAATQHFSTQPRGFVWDAGIRVLPLMEVRVRDAYVAGLGSMQARLLFLVPVVDLHGAKELNEGSLQRYLAEAVWFPTALLPGQGVKWSAIDDNRALATLTDSGTTVSLEFAFSEAGDIAGIFSPGRYREVDGNYVLTPWEGRFLSFQEREGMRIPMEGEVAWHLPEGRFPYWKGKVMEVRYERQRH